MKYTQHLKNNRKISKLKNTYRKGEDLKFKCSNTTKIALKSTI